MDLRENMKKMLTRGEMDQNYPQGKLCEADRHRPRASWGFTCNILVQFSPGGYTLISLTGLMTRNMIIFKIYYFNTSRHNMLS